MKRTTNHTPAHAGVPASRARRPCHISFTALVGKQYVRLMRMNLHAAHGMLQPPLRELSLAIVNDKTMSDLHLQFMNIPGPTDVLTFPLETDSRGHCLSGEVIVCLPEARRRAKELRHKIEHELLLYALHGMLHLCGFDDRTKSGYMKMHAMEDRLLQRLGIGRIFAGSAGAGNQNRRKSGVC